MLLARLFVSIALAAGFIATIGSSLHSMNQPPLTARVSAVSAGDSTAPPATSPSAPAAPSDAVNARAVEPDVRKRIDATLREAELKKAEALKQADKAKEEALKKAEELEKKAEEAKAEALKKAQAALQQAQQILQQVQNTPAPQPSTSAPAPAVPPNIAANFSQTGTVSGTVNVTVNAPGVTQLELDGQRNGSLIQKYITVLDTMGNGTFSGQWDTTQTPNGTVAITAAFSTRAGNFTRPLASFTINNPIVQSPAVDVRRIIPQPTEPATSPSSNVIQNAITSLQDIQQQLQNVTMAQPTQPAPTTTPHENEPASSASQSSQTVNSPSQTAAVATSPAPASGASQLQPPRPPEVKQTTPSPAARPEVKSESGQSRPTTTTTTQPQAANPVSVPAPPSPPPPVIPTPVPAPPQTPSAATPPPAPPAAVIHPNATSAPPLPPVAPTVSSGAHPSLVTQQAPAPQAPPVNLSSTDPRTGGISVPAVLKIDAVTVVAAPNPPAPVSLPSQAPPEVTPAQPPVKPANPPAPNQKLVLAGRAIPNAFITLFIYSDPLVIDVRADASGRWEYTLDRHISDGRHEVYVAITDTTGRVIVKSNPFQFIKTAQAVSVVAATPTPENILAPDSNITTRQFMLFMVLAVFGAILLGFVIIAVVAKSRQR